MDLMRTFISALLMLIWICPSSEADLILFDFGTGNVVGPVLTQELTSQTVGGVTFDVTLTVTASDDIKITSGALGIQSAGENGQPALHVNDGESLLSFVVSFANESGGTMQFDGWAQATYESVTTPDPDTNSNSSGDTVVDGTVALTGSPISWSTTGGTGGDFQLTSINGNFSVAAVPEPSSFVLFSALALVGFRRRRPGAACRVCAIS